MTASEQEELAKVIRHEMFTASQPQVQLKKIDLTPFTSKQIFSLIQQPDAPNLSQQDYYPTTKARSRLQMKTLKPMFQADASKLSNSATKAFALSRKRDEENSSQMQHAMTSETHAKK